MDNAEQILVVTLATALAIFLVLAIVIATQVIRLMKVLQMIAVKAQDIVASAEATTEMIKNAAGKLSFLSFVHTIMESVGKYAKKGK